jgi:hypothetical protein
VLCSTGRWTLQWKERANKTSRTLQEKISLQVQEEHQQTNKQTGSRLLRRTTTLCSLSSAPLASVQLLLHYPLLEAKLCIDL